MTAHPRCGLGALRASTLRPGQPMTSPECGGGLVLSPLERGAGRKFRSADVSCGTAPGLGQALAMKRRSRRRQGNYDRGGLPSLATISASASLSLRAGARVSLCQVRDTERFCHAERHLQRQTTPGRSSRVDAPRATPIGAAPLGLRALIQPIKARRGLSASRVHADRAGRTRRGDNAAEYCG